MPSPVAVGIATRLRPDAYQHKLYISLCCSRKARDHTLSNMRHLLSSARLGTSLCMTDCDVCSAHRISIEPTPLPLQSYRSTVEDRKCTLTELLAHQACGSDDIRESAAGNHLWHMQVDSVADLERKNKARLDCLQQPVLPCISSELQTTMHVEIVQAKYVLAVRKFTPGFLRHCYEVNESVPRVQRVT